MTIENCKLCRKKIKNGCLMTTLGTICMDCAGDINLSEFQPISQQYRVIWCIAELFFEKGSGNKKITFKDVWNSHEHHTKLIEQKDILPGFKK
jgi:hypothetical protein